MTIFSKIITISTILASMIWGQALADEAISIGNTPPITQSAPEVVLPTTGVIVNQPATSVTAVQSNVGVEVSDIVAGQDKNTNASVKPFEQAKNQVDVDATVGSHVGVPHGEVNYRQDVPVTAQLADTQVTTQGGSDTGSVIFKDEELQQITAAVRLYESKKKGGKGGVQESGGNIYLNSIIENAQGEWVVWVNNSKVNGQKITSNLSLVNVNREHAFFKWIVVDIDQVVPNWRSEASEIDDNRYKMNDYPIEISIVSQNVGVVNFALQVNQTFIPQQLAVIEGRVYTGSPVSNIKK